MTQTQVVFEEPWSDVSSTNEISDGDSKRQQLAEERLARRRQRMRGNFLLNRGYTEPLKGYHIVFASHKKCSQDLELTQIIKKLGGQVAEKISRSIEIRFCVATQRQVRGKLPRVVLARRLGLRFVTPQVVKESLGDATDIDEWVHENQLEEDDSDQEESESSAEQSDPSDRPVRES
ncbi:MAG: LOW QUALITY PROTEIN: uncharacterized protein KVP18_002573 [Porospora cf. gigantea A]|uniref:uncharacterized protein n=1 Tax=Porospora cf. gigantea A TaxID=2853593 RepID=UPI003559BE8E|nr:MAG: LOW QUALITY PROTEIN: hypothetical protein KVP18_002573 [Porospora cf. gigantea A]